MTEIDVASVESVARRHAVAVGVCAECLGEDDIDEPDCIEQFCRYEEEAVKPLSRTVAMCAFKESVDLCSSLLPFVYSFWF